MLKILIVDDSEDDLSLVSHILTSHGYTFMTASSGRKAIDKIKLDSFDVVVSDFQMEDGNGLWLAEEIEKLDPEIYFILVSSDFAQTEDFYQSFGVDTFLPKPIQAQALVAKLRNISVRTF